MATLTSHHRSHHTMRRRFDFSIRRAPPVPNPNEVYLYWLQGRYTRNPCKFLHPEPDDHQPTARPPTDVVCRFWASPSATCTKGDNCRFLHAWYRSTDDPASFSMRARLVGGHGHPVVGISFPVGSNHLFTVAEDGTVIAWDSDTGKPAQEANLGGRVGCVISEGPWVFVGLNGSVRATHVNDERVDFSLSGPIGQVTALSTSDDALFARSEDGSIHAWKFNSNADAHGHNFQPMLPFKGHGRPVISLCFGAGQLFSGYADGTIRVLDTNGQNCLQTIEAHRGAVSAFICWDKFLLSSSLDGTTQVWGATETGDLSSVYTHEEEAGVVSMFGMVDLEGKSVLYSSCKDNVVRLYDLPSFQERGRIFASKEIGAIQHGPGGIFFTGDGTGDGTGVVSVWQWAKQFI